MGLATHDRKPWAEIDFVAIGPAGIFCLEVKGGRIGRTEGMWTFTDKNGRTGIKREGPFEQVGSASTALYKYLCGKLPQIASSVVGYGVVIPDVYFDIEGPDVPKEVVYDLRDNDKPFSRYLSNLTAYWQRRLNRSRQLSESAIRDIVDVLKGDFDLRPSLHTLAGLAESEFVRLTNQQCAVMDGLVDNARAIVRGGAGTGKSLLAVYESRRLAAMGKRALLCCFNKLLATELRGATTDYDAIEVRHLHGLMASLVGRSRFRELTKSARTSDELLRVALPRVCIESLHDPGFLQFDAVVLDEGQDLLCPEYLHVIDLLLKGGLKDGFWRVFYDPNQNLFRTLNPAAFQMLNNCGPAHYRLVQNCRNTAPIGLTTAMVAGIKPDEVYHVSGPQVRQLWYRSVEEQVEKLTAEVRFLIDEGLAPNRIVILAEQRLEKTGLGRSCRYFPFRIRDLTSDVVRAQDDAVNFSTIHAYKGLESDAAILIDVDDLRSAEASHLLYVGASRAKFFLTLVMHEQVRLDYQRRAEEFGRLCLQT